MTHPGLKKHDAADIGYQDTDLPPTDQGRFDPRSWFPEERRHLPIELEIGSGKGTFIVAQAQATPDVNYLGIEWARAYWLYAADRARRNNLQNVRMLRADAAAFVRTWNPDGIFRQIHIYFPDPWPKARHNKRRIIQAPFLGELHRILLPEGRVRIATDHEAYFQWMNEHIALVPHLFDKLPYESPAAAGEGELVGSNFERKYRREGRPFFSMILARKNTT
jgi:tRNA (guanine-N7-)-methyltransferase